MVWNFTFFLNSVLLGIGLAMDAFSVSCANALNEPEMKKSKMFGIAGIFAFFQIAMPLIGWLCIHTVAEKFEAFQKFIPWIALALLGFIGTKMLIEGLRAKKGDAPKTTVGFAGLIVQGIATSIDALSVGFTISELAAVQATVESLIIGIVTFAICMIGLLIGKTLGTKLSGFASILGGVILIGIGVEIFITNIFF